MHIPGLDLKELRRHANACVRRNSDLDPDELVQKTVERILEKKILSRVNPSVGTVMSLAIGVLRNVAREMARTERRARRRRSAGFLVAGVDQSPLEQLIEQEDRNRLLAVHRILRLWWDEITERQRWGVVRVTRLTLFGYSPDRAPTGADYVAACRARARLADLLKSEDLTAP